MRSSPKLFIPCIRAVMTTNLHDNWASEPLLDKFCERHHTFAFDEAFATGLTAFFLHSNAIVMSYP